MAKDTHIRIPPQDVDAERAVIGSIMVRSGAIHDVSDILTRESFYFEKHGMIYETMLELSLRSEPIDILSLSSRLKEKKMLDAVGGNAALADIASTVPSSTNAKYYAEIVQKKNILRELIRSADTIAELGFAEGDMSIEEVLEHAEKSLLEMKARPNSKKFIAIKDAVTEEWLRIEKLHENKGQLRGVPTGFTKLDDMLSGLQPSDLIILAARPSVGKTTFALDIARHAATVHKVPVAIFSLEMSAHQLVNRMLSAESKVNAWNLRTGNVTAQSDFAALQESISRLAQAPIFIDDQAGSNLVRLRSICRRIKAEHGLGMIVIDYLQLMSTMKNYDSMVNQVTEISRGLKGLAKEFDVPVLALSQLSRAVESRGGKPRLSDLRDSGSIEQDADIVMFLHNEDKYKEESERTGIMEILIEKHRNGPVGKVDLIFDQKTTSFINIDGQYQSMAPTTAKPDKYNLDDF